MNILAVGCHPDDLELACYGTLARFVKEGHKVVAVHVCNGNLGHVQIMPPELAAIRNREAEKAAEVIGAEAITLDVGDLHVDSNDHEVIRKLSAIIRFVKPDLIISHNPDDYMQDHTETSRLALNASFGASVPHYISEGTPCSLTPFYYMDTPAGVNFNPTEYVDISDVIEIKLEALSKHESQVKWMLDHDGIDFLDFVRACSRGRGCQCGVKYAEGFRPAEKYLRMTTKRMLP